jgi:sigma-B regulation protein RsbU (phosphoserine phosphatase)
MVKLAATSQRSQADDPAALLQGMNSALHGNTQSQFVTAAYVYLDAQAKEFRYSAAGHPPMLLLREGTVIEIAENGLMLAAFDFATYATGASAATSRPPCSTPMESSKQPIQRVNSSAGNCRICCGTRLLSALSEAADRIIHSVQTWASSQDDDLTVLVCDYAR